MRSDLLGVAVAHQRDAILITEGARISSRGRRILFVNEGFTALTGYSSDEVIGQSPGVTVGEKTSRAALDGIQEAIEAVRPIPRRSSRTARTPRPCGSTSTYGRHLLTLINEILDLTRLEADRMPVHLSRFDAADLVRQVVAELEPIISRAGLFLACELPPGLGSVRTDRQRLKQILLNLLSNALTFTREGSMSRARWGRARFTASVSLAPRARRGRRRPA